MKQLPERIRHLNKECRNACVARFYVQEEQAEIADSVGDSCCLPVAAVNTAAKTGETSKLPMEELTIIPSRLCRGAAKGSMRHHGFLQ